jgi:hypothetical protein
MITGITIENFKGIRERVQIPLKPITLLFGANSAGKSSIIHALHYAREILERRNLNPDRTLGGEDLVDLGGFASFIHGHDRGSNIHLGFDLDLKATPLPSFWGAVPRAAPLDEPESLYGAVEGARLELTISWSELLNTACATRYAVGINNLPLAEIGFQPGSPDVTIALNTRHPVFVRARDNSTIWSWHPLEPDEWDESDSALSALLSWVVHSRAIAGIGSGQPPFTEVLGLDGQTDALPKLEQRIRFAGDWVFSEGNPEFADSSVSEMMDYLCAAVSELVIGPAIVLRDLLKETRYVGPIRQVPPRGFQKPRFREAHQWVDGTAAWNLLLEGNNELVSQVRAWLADSDKLNVGYRVEPKWFREFGREQVESIESLLTRLSFDADADLIKQLVLEELAKPAWSARLALYSISTDIEVEPQDVGVGISQLVPVVVAVLDQHKGITAIEQPELHLHPAVQVGLGDLLIAGTRPGARVLVIETHSEHLLLRLLRRIREGTEGALSGNQTRLCPEMLAVVYVESDQGRITVTPLRVDETGEFRDRWPKGFFREREPELF